MTNGGWIMMVSSWLFIGGLSLFCMLKVVGLREKDAARIKPIEEIDTEDRDDTKS